MEIEAKARLDAARLKKDALIKEAQSTRGKDLEDRDVD